MRLRSLFLLAVCACATAQTPVQSGSWLQVQTPHFQIVSNASETDARRAAHQFEGMRSVFQRVFPDADLDTTSPVLVLAVQGKKDMQALEPMVYLGQGQLTLLGLFVAAPERNYVLVLLNAPTTHPYGPIYHEYAHFVFSRRHEWMPLWLTEGIAEFYQYTEILDDKVRIGKGDPYIQAVLDRNPLLPLSTLFAVDPHSPYYHEQDKGSIFYAESWALTHYLKDKDGLDGAHRLNDFLELLQKNVDPTSAATQAFGDLDQLELDFRKYVATTQFAVTEISGSTEVDESSFVVRTLTQPQADTYRAEMLAHDERLNDARVLLDGVLRDDPSSATAREILGFIAYRQDYYDEARRWCQEALKLDANNYLAHYFFAAASIRKGAADKASRTAIEESLRSTIRITPTFAPAYDALAMFYANSGANFTEAHDLIEHAVQLEPGVPELRVDEAQILDLLHKEKDALAVLDLALKMSHTPEQIAAIENVRQNLLKVDAERTKQKDQKLVFYPPSTQKSGQNTAFTNAARASQLPNETPPRATYAPEVEYTEEARAARLEGICTVELIVGIDGNPSNVVVTKKLGMGLDDRALETVRRWKFEPGRRNGRPVPSRLTLNLQFKLVGDPQKFFDLSEKAQAGDADAEFRLATAFFEGRDIPKDEAQGMALLERSARSGHPQAQFEMGNRTYGDGTDSTSYVTAYLWYSVAQRNGAAQAEAKVQELESRMTPDQLSDARKRLETWPASVSK